MSIRLNLQPQTQQVQCRSATIVPDSEPDVVQNEQFYVVKSDNEEGFIITQCKKIHQNYFEGYLLDKCSDDTSHLLYRLLGMPSKENQNNLYIIIPGRKGEVFFPNWPAH